MYEFHDDPKKIKAQIKRYERALKKEQELHGFFDDGYGKRYLLGPLYLLMDDIDGAVKSYQWFEENFPDDYGEPLQYLCWTLALYRNGDIEAASDKLIQTMMMNLYMIPHLLGMKLEVLKIWHGSNRAEIEYVEYLPVEIFKLWDKKALAWAEKLYHSPKIEAIGKRYIEIQEELNVEHPGPRRTQLVNESCKMEDLDFSEL